MTTLVTLGCRLNIAESAAIGAMLGDRPDLVVVNGCAVTAEAMRGTAKAARRARRDRPDARIVVTGCAGQLDSARFAAMPQVDRVLGNADKLVAAAYADDGPDVRVSPILDVMRTAPHLADSFSAHERAFVEVQSGCDHRCTFCIIPYARGPSRSVPAAQVVDAIARAVERGHREVVLTGVDLTSYAADGLTLGQLVERILANVPALPRLRLSSLDPVEVDDRLFALIVGEPRLMPHLHLSLQAGDDLILKRMRRRHSRSQALDLIARLRAERPEVAIGADLISGFPTEDDRMAENSRALIDEAQIAFAHIFPYSPRPGTPAARMPQVDPAIVRQRAARLRDTAAAVKARLLDGMIGTVQAILVERDGLTGHAPNFARLRLRAPRAAGSLLSVNVVARDGDMLIVEPA